MSEQANQKPNNENQNQNHNGNPSDGTKNTENFIPYERFKEINDKYKETQKQLDELLKKQQEAEIEDQKTQGKYQELYEKLNAEHEPLKEQFKKYQETFQSVLKNKLDQVPEEFRELIPKGNEIEQLQWIENAISKGLFKKDNPQSFGNGGNNPANANQYYKNLESLSFEEYKKARSKNYK